MTEDEKICAINDWISATWPDEFRERKQAPMMLLACDISKEQQTEFLVWIGSADKDFLAIVAEYLEKSAAQLRAEFNIPKTHSPFGN